MCILVEPTEQQLQRRKMPELQNTMNAIFGVPDDGASIVENIQKECKKKDKLEKQFTQPQVPLEGSNKRPKVKKPKETVNLYNNLRDVLEDPPLSGDELRVPPPQPQVPTNLLMPGPSSAGFIEELPRASRLWRKPCVTRFTANYSIINQWDTLSCRCGLVPKLQLSLTPRNMNKVFLACPKP